MVVAQVRSIRFLLDKYKHTVAYADTGAHFEKSFNEMTPELRNGNYEAVIAKDLDDAVAKIAGQVGDAAKRWNISAEDIRFTIQHSLVGAGGFFYIALSCYGDEYQAVDNSAIQTRV